MKNERGFSFLEGLLSLSLLFLICITLLPFVFSMMNKLSDGKKEMIGYRLLYEYVEQHPISEYPEKENRLSQGIQYELFYEGKAGSRRACFRYEDQQKCVQ
ncbi:hypothetical protein ACA30_05955 [Virgibacillus soli]|uniref:Type II secretion system protein n=1 Tax=Lederbergia galactosidilytica TaxID=217031 RepID=A0A0Q9YB26_9BACI|nr:hypothetical protein ACA29_05330 [Lederbergia galactosidilytica]KRG15628.1 hypothetical protein ACA30_05955 [Virgibacillus soli]